MPQAWSPFWKGVIGKLPVILLGVAALGSIGAPLGIWSSHVERMSHFRLGWVGMLIALTLLFLRHHCRAFAIVAISIAGISLVPLLSYWVPSARPVSGKGIKFIAWNLLWENPRKHEALPWLTQQDADVMLLTECTQAWRDELEALKETHPHRFHSGHDGAEGMWLLSRFPMDPPDPEGLSQAKPWISTVLHTQKGPIRVIGMHPRTPRSGTRFDQRNVQYQRAAEISANSAMPVVILGDLNCTPFSPWFRRLLDRGKLRDSAVGFGLPATWRSNGIGLPIDHILVSDHWQVQSRIVFPDRMGSDHSPVIAVLSGMGFSSEDRR